MHAEDIYLYLFILSNISADATTIFLYNIKYKTSIKHIIFSHSVVPVK